MTKEETFFEPPMNFREFINDETFRYLSQPLPMKILSIIYVKRQISVKDLIQEITGKDISNKNEKSAYKSIGDNLEKLEKLGFVRWEKPKEKKQGRPSKIYSVRIPAIVDKTIQRTKMPNIIEVKNLLAKLYSLEITRTLINPFALQFWVNRNIERKFQPDSDVFVTDNKRVKTDYELKSAIKAFDYLYIWDKWTGRGFRFSAAYCFSYFFLHPVLFAVYFAKKEKLKTNDINFTLLGDGENVPIISQVGFEFEESYIRMFECFYDTLLKFEKRDKQKYDEEMAILKEISPQIVLYFWFSFFEKVQHKPEFQEFMKKHNKNKQILIYLNEGTI